MTDEPVSDAVQIIRATLTSPAFDTSAQRMAARLNLTFIHARRMLSNDLAFFVTHHQPTSTRSGRWRLRLLGKMRVYRTRALALAALRRELIKRLPRE